jgi:hypothetical protein
MKMGRFRALLGAAAAASLALVPVANAGAASNQFNPHLLTAPTLQRLTNAQMAKLGLQPSTKQVIVIMKNQYMALASTRHDAIAKRSSVISAAERPIVAELNQVRASKIKAFNLINAVSATVSTGELKYLKAQTGVRSVVPDKRLYLPKPVIDNIDAGTAKSSARTFSGQSLARRSSARKATPPPSCNANQPTLEPEALTQINAQYQNPSQKGQAALLANGHGVNVAFMADGVSFNDSDFIRPNGDSVFSDVEDFGGSGGFYYGGETEGMLDASSIGAQGNERYFVGEYTSSLNHAFNFANSCPVIKLVGDAPGANLVDLQVFGTYATTSGFVQAIQYAVNNHVNVLNQSFGSNPYPDQNTDPISIADQAAVAAGVTVVASAGDAGANGTQGAPSTLPGVIAAGASTSFQIYKQLGDGGFPLSNGNYVDNGVSSLSSAGPNQAGTKGVDVLAPGDLNWVLCDAGAVCKDPNGDNVGVWESGGTSESAPLVSGVAADVIQKYRATHNGASPTPEVVKEIITSTATNLNLPSNVQGAGLLNAYKAVEMAASWHITVTSASSHVGNTLAVNVNNCLATKACNMSLSAAGVPGASKSWTVAVTNTGQKVEKVTPSITHLSQVGSGTGSVTLNPATDPFFYDTDGYNRSYKEVTTTVGSGVSDVNFSVSWNTAADPGALVRVSVLDPSGAFACYSLPQGSGNGYGSCMVNNPHAGTYTLIIWTRGVAGIGYTGNVNWSAVSSKFVSAGTVTPATKRVYPGFTSTFTVASTIPTASGDSAASVVVIGKVGGMVASNVVVPVVLRSMIPISGKSGTFSGSLLGGNGRSGAANAQTYQFTVPAGQADLSVGIALADSNSNYSYEAILTDPSGVPADVQSNVTSVDSSGNPDGYQPTLQLWKLAPTAGTWSLTVLTNFYSGPSITEGFTGTIAFNSLNVVPAGVPDNVSTTISSSSPVDATITVTNTGNSPEMYYADPRLTTTHGYYLLPSGATYAGPVASDGFLAPTQTNELLFTPTGDDATDLNVEGVYDAGNGPVGYMGTPDVFSAGASNAPSVSYSAAEVPSGEWVEDSDNLACPCQAGGVDHNQKITIQAVGVMKDFDDAAIGGNVTTSTGDFWTNSLSTPLVLNPGASGVINVEINPTGSPGDQVTGNIYVDTLAVEAPGYLNNNGFAEEVASVPYAFTVGSTCTVRGDNQPAC